jgi:hypothetical protein
MPMPTLDRKIQLIEALIESRRRNRMPDDGQDEIIETLSSIATDLRSSAPGAAAETRRVIGEKIAALVRDNQRARHLPPPGLGWQSGKLIAIGQEVVGRWRTIEAALEKHGQDIDQDDAFVGDGDTHAEMRSRFK